MVVLKYVLFFVKNRNKFVFRTPLKSDVLVYNRVGSEFIVDALLKDITYTIIETRGEKYYLSFVVIIQYMKNLWLYRLAPTTAYILSLLKIVKPKVIVTFHHRKNFKTLMKYYDAEYLSIQNGIVLESGLSSEKELYIPNLFCFGKREIELYKKSTVKVGNFFPVGSLKAGYYKNHLAPHNNNIKYDICLISQYRSRIEEFGQSITGMEEYGLMQEFLLHYLRNRSLSLVIALVSDKEESNLERSYYEKIYGSKAILMKNNREEYSTYFTIDQSDVIISNNSTIAFEALGWGKKTFIFSISGSLDFTLNRRYSKHFVMYEKSFNEFEKKIDCLRNMTSSEYARLIKKDKDYLMNYNPDAPAHKIIRKKIKEHLM